MKIITIDRALLEQALEALAIGQDAAYEVAQTYHEAMAGYRPARHIAVDDDVRKIEDAITALRAALAQEQAEQTWVCPDSPEHRYKKPGYCEDCGKTLVLAQEQAEPVQEPVAVVRWNDIGHISWRTHVMLPDGTPLYTAQPQRKPLSDEEIERIRADEREACARRLEAIGCDHCAANIRARSKA